MKNIEIFFSSFSQEHRLLIDKLSGSIFEIFPNIKEKVNISRKKLEYYKSEYGNFLEIFLNNDFIVLRIKKKSEILIELYFKSLEEISTQDLEKVIFEKIK